MAYDLLIKDAQVIDGSGEASSTGSEHCGVDGA